MQGPQEYAGRWFDFLIVAKIAKGLVVLLLLFLLFPANNLAKPRYSSPSPTAAPQTSEKVPITKVQ